MLNRKERHCRGTKPTDWPLIVILAVMIANIHSIVKLTNG